MDPLDEALRELREIRPSPHFVPRLRAHVEASRRPVPRFWLPAAAAAAFVVLAIVATSLRRGEVQRIATGSDIALVASTPTASESRETREPRERREPGERRARKPSEPGRLREFRESRESQLVAVLVPANQRAVMTRLLDSLTTGETDGAAVARSLTTGAELVVAPIRIDPVTVPAMAAGVPVSDK